MVRVMAFGTFDGLHAGHRSYLEQAKHYGDELIVVVARDATVEAVKHHSPLQPEGERLAGVKRVAGVDQAVLGNRLDKYAVIRQFQPDVICLGYDQQAFTDLLVHEFPTIRIVRLQPFHPEQYKSSKLRNAPPL